MDMSDFAGDGCAYVVGTAKSAPPLFAAFREDSPSGWRWTTGLTDAESFPTRKQAELHLTGDMAALVDGNEDVKVLKVELKVSEAT